MTLRQFVTLTEAYDRVDARRAMVAVLARERPRSVEGYRRFYRARALTRYVRRLPAGLIATAHVGSRVGTRGPSHLLDRDGRAGLLL